MLGRLQLSVRHPPWIPGGRVGGAAGHPPSPEALTMRAAPHPNPRIQVVARVDALSARPVPPLPRVAGRATPSCEKRPRLSPRAPLSAPTPSNLCRSLPLNRRQTVEGSCGLVVLPQRRRRQTVCARKVVVSARYPHSVHKIHADHSAHLSVSSVWPLTVERLLVFQQ